MRADSSLRELRSSLINEDAAIMNVIAPVTRATGGGPIHCCCLMLFRHHVETAASAVRLAPAPLSFSLDRQGGCPYVSFLIPTALPRRARHCEYGLPRPHGTEKSSRRRSFPCVRMPEWPAQPFPPSLRAVPFRASSWESDPRYIPALGRPRYAPSPARGLAPRSQSCLRRRSPATQFSLLPACNFE